MDAVHLAVQHLQHLVTLFPKILPNTLRRQKKLLCQGCMRVFITAAIAKKVWNSVIKWVVNPLSLAILIVLNNFKRRKILFFWGCLHIPFSASFRAMRYKSSFAASGSLWAFHSYPAALQL